MSNLCQKCKKHWGHRLRNYPNFENLAHVIQHGLQGFILKNIDGEATEGEDVNHIL